jgi:hypothetical protein
MSENVNITIEQSETSASGLRKYTVRMFTSDRPRLTTNELPHILHAIKHSRYVGKYLYTLDFKEEDYPYDPDDFHGTLTLICRYGKDDITGALLQADIVWTRYSEDSEGNPRTSSDEAWNISHDYHNWLTGREQLTLQQSDLDAGVELPSLLQFTAEVTVRDGFGDALGTAAVTYEYIN